MKPARPADGPFADRRSRPAAVPKSLKRARGPPGASAHSGMPPANSWFAWAGEEGRPPTRKPPRPALAPPLYLAPPCRRPPAGLGPLGTEGRSPPPGEAPCFGHVTEKEALPPKPRWPRGDAPGCTLSRPTRRPRLLSPPTPVGFASSPTSSPLPSPALAGALGPRPGGSLARRDFPGAPPVPQKNKKQQKTRRSRLNPGGGGAPNPPSSSQKGVNGGRVPKIWGWAAPAVRGGRKSPELSPPPASRGNLSPRNWKKAPRKKGGNGFFAPPGVRPRHWAPSPPPVPCTPGFPPGVSAYG